MQLGSKEDKMKAVTHKSDLRCCIMGLRVQEAYDPSHLIRHSAFFLGQLCNYRIEEGELAACDTWKVESRNPFI